MAKIKVLIVDDSAIVRRLLNRMLSSDDGIEVVATAPDPYVAREMVLKYNPDVITLDIEMPRMDGITFLTKLMAHRPVRTVIISSLSKRGSVMALDALEAGAIDVIEKPSLDVSRSLLENGQEIITKVKAAAQAQLIVPQKDQRTLGSRVVPQAKPGYLRKTTHQVLAMASSTGGTEALKCVLPHLPADVPGILIVQHMPPGFTKTFAESLNSMCPFEVKEAEQGDRVRPGVALIAPGNFHMEVKRSGGFYHVSLHQKPPLHGVRPAADHLLKSVAAQVGPNAVGVVLTGMGKDGAQGLLEMKRAGGYNISQDEKSCVIYGMPREAVKLGAIDKEAPLNQISELILAAFKDKEKMAA